MKNKIDVMEAYIAPEMLGNYLTDLGFEQEDFVFIKKVGRHLEIGKVSFECIK